MIDLSGFPTLQEGIDSAGGAPAGFYLPAGTYPIDRPLIVSAHGSYFVGDGQEASRIICNDPTADGILVSAPQSPDAHVHGFGFRGLGFKTNLPRTGGAYIHLSRVQTVAIADISMDSPFYGFQFTDTTIMQLSDFDIRSPCENGIGIKIDGVNDSNDHWIRDGIVRGNPAINSRAAVEIENTAFSDLTAVDGYRCGIGLIMIARQAPADTMGRANVESVWTSKCSWDTCNSHGVLVVTGPGGIVRRYRSNQDSMMSNHGSGVAVAGPGVMEGFDFVQAQIHNNDLHGMDFQAGSDVDIDTSRIGGNSMSAPKSAHGVRFMTGVKSVKVRNSIIGPNNQFPAANQGYGIYRGGSAGDGDVITNNDLRGNILGGLFDQGSGNRIVGQNLL